MKKTLLVVLGLAVTLGLAFLSGGSRAQTVQGDILRGRGRFLEGLGWYKLNTARADSINVETWKSANREYQRLYRDYMIDRYRHIQYKRGLTNKMQQDAERQFEEDQQRYRTKPNADDIISGAALNALAGDLADPSISPSSWRGATVDLPTGVSLTMLGFKIFDKKTAALSRSVVAIDRMLVKDGWPLAFRRPEIEAERASYEKSVGAVVEKCRKGTELQARDYDQLRDTVSSLETKIKEAIPPLDQPKSRAFVKQLDAYTKIFTEQSYAEQLIRDVSEHKATTIAELLAFMREYRLLFSDPGDSPVAESLYERLYALLRQQLSALGLDRASANSDRLSAGSIWHGMLTFQEDRVEKKAAVKTASKNATPKKAAPKKAAPKKPDGPQYQLIVQSRSGNRFSGQSIFVGTFGRKVEGTVGGGLISYRETDNDGKGFRMNGTISGGQIHFQFQGQAVRGAQRSGEGRLICQ